MRYTAIVDDRPFDIELGPKGQVIVDGRPYSVDIRCIDGSSLYSLLIGGRSYEVFIEEREGEYRVLLEGELHAARVEDEWTRRLAKVEVKPWVPSGEVAIRAPMPGLVLAVPVKVGQEVQADQSVVILEAMKMENELRALTGGTVQSVRVAPGDIVEQNKILVTIRAGA